SLDHVRQHRAARPQRREQRAPNLGFDLFLFVMLVGLRPDGPADVVDENVDAVPSPQRFLDHAEGAGISLEVGLVGGSGTPAFPARIDDPANELRTAHGKHRPPLRRDANRHAATDALRGSRYDDYLAFEARQSGHCTTVRTSCSSLRVRARCTLMPLRL